MLIQSAYWCDLFNGQLSSWLLLFCVPAWPVVFHFVLGFSFLSRALIHRFCFYQSNSSICQDHFGLWLCPPGFLQHLSAWLHQILWAFSILSNSESITRSLVRVFHACGSFSVISASQIILVNSFNILSWIPLYIMKLTSSILSIYSLIYAFSVWACPLVKINCSK